MLTASKRAKIAEWHKRRNEIGIRELNKRFQTVFSEHNYRVPQPSDDMQICSTERIAYQEEHDG